MTLGFGPQHERFRHSLFIILVNRLVTCAVAAAALSLMGKSLQPAAPLALFAVPSIANVFGSASQYEALKYVSFPLQALAKCAKTVSKGGRAAGAARGDPWDGFRHLCGIDASSLWRHGCCQRTLQPLCCGLPSRACCPTMLCTAASTSVASSQITRCLLHLPPGLRTLHSQRTAGAQG